MLLSVINLPGTNDDCPSEIISRNISFRRLLEPWSLISTPHYTILLGRIAIEVLDSAFLESKLCKYIEFNGKVPDMFLDMTLGSVVPRAEIGSAQSTVPTKHPDPAQPSPAQCIQKGSNRQVHVCLRRHPRPPQNPRLLLVG
jgi:hypothetical protein